MLIQSVCRPTLFCEATIQRVKVTIQRGSDLRAVALQMVIGEMREPHQAIKCTLPSKLNLKLKTNKQTKS